MEMPVPEENPPWEVLLRKQLLLLATLVVGITYAAGINPPGGVWQENGSSHKAGESFLLGTHRRTYLASYYCNSTALAASVVVVFLLLLKKPRRGPQLVLLRVVLLVDLMGLAGAYAVGSSRDYRLSLYPLTLTFIILGYIIVVVFHHQRQEEPQQGTEEEDLDDRAPLQPKKQRKVLMLLASFTTVITYVAGLSSSGGYWDRIEAKYKQGDDALVGLDHKAKARFRAFFYCNATAFMASVFLVLLLLNKNIGAWVLWPVSTLHCLPCASMRRSLAIGIRSVMLYVLVLAALLGLLGAYAAGTYRKTGTSVYVFYLIGAFLAYIFLVMAIACWRCQSSSDATTITREGGVEQAIQVDRSVLVQLGGSTEESRKVKSILLLLASLTATVTYQEGLDPPGGVWQDDLDGHSAGKPILLSTDPWRYKFFLYCNFGAFLLSLAVISMLMAPIKIHKEKIQKTLRLLMIVDMVSLMGAYGAGSWRDARSLIYVVAMAGGVIVYVIIHVLCITIRTTDMDCTRLMKKRHTRLLLVIILVAAITYHAGLHPPGGFRQQDDGHTAGAVLLMDNYPRRFWAFYYFNTVSFVGTMAPILLFICSNLHRLAIRFYALYACMLVALLGLVAANAVGVGQTYAYVFVLMAVLVSVIAVRTIKSSSFLQKEERGEDEDEGSNVVTGPATIPRPRPRPRPVRRRRLRSVQEIMYREAYASHKHLMLLGILTAGATYQAGLNPPGSLWQDDSNLGDTGSPMLYDRFRLRFHIFLYSISTSFVVSVFIVALQLQQVMPTHRPKNSKVLMLASKVALMIDLLGLLVAVWEYQLFLLDS